MSKNFGNSDNIILDWRKDYHAGLKYRFVHHFVPHPEGNSRATLLSPKSLIFYCFLILLVTGLFRIIPLVFPNILGYATNINASDLLKDTNKKRAESGLAALKINNLLSVAAQKKAEHMFKHDYWAHIAPDGTEPWDFILGENYDYIYAGENLAKNFSDSDDVVNAWYNSPSHKENLLSKNYTEVGFAVMNGKLNGYETTLVVQMFGKPRSPAQAADATPPDNNLAYDAKPAPVNEVPNVQPVISEAPQTQPVPQPFSDAGQRAEVKPLMDVRTASRWMTFLFGGFVTFLLGLDFWYSSKKGVVKLGGHTLIHLSFLLIAMIGIWVVLVPGTIL